MRGPIRPTGHHEVTKPALPRSLRHSSGTVIDYIGPPLTRESLAALLDAEGIAERAYSLYGEHKSDAIVLDNRPKGWVVFYSERGGEDELAVYKDEAEACLDVFRRVLEYDHNRFDLVAGPAPPAEADEQFYGWPHDHGLQRADLADSDWKSQDSPWKAGEPDYRRYWVRITKIREVS